MLSSILVFFAKVLLTSKQVICGEVSENSTSSIDSDTTTFQLLEWLRENGAYINGKLEVRHVVPDEPSSTRGVFATTEMDKDEIVCTIPWKLMLKPSKELKKRTTAEQSDCGTMHEVVRATSEDTITPYGKYLLTLPRDYTAGFWSKVSCKC